jgi:hypothetical protein
MRSRLVLHNSGVVIPLLCGNTAGAGFWVTCWLLIDFRH